MNTEAFEIFPGVIVPPGTYDDHETQIVAMSNQGAALSKRQLAARWVSVAL